MGGMKPTSPGQECNQYTQTPTRWFAPPTFPWVSCGGYAQRKNRRGMTHISGYNAGWWLQAVVVVKDFLHYAPRSGPQLSGTYG